MFDVQEEINDSIQQGPKDPNLDVTTADLEQELEAILAGEGDSKEHIRELTDELGELSVADKQIIGALPLNRLPI